MKGGRALAAKYGGALFSTHWGTGGILVSLLFCLT